MTYRWNELEERFTPPFEELLKEEEVYLLSLVKSDWDVLELGCGTGRLLAKLSPNVRRIEGVEYEYEQIRIAKGRTKDFPNARVRYSDARSLPEELCNGFDLTYSVFNTLGNQGHEKFVFLQEAAKTVKSGGTMVFSVYSEDALKCQLEWYHHLGYKTQVVGDYVLGKNHQGKGWVSERFTQDKLKDLFSDNGFANFGIRKLTDIAYVCKLRL